MSHVVCARLGVPVRYNRATRIPKEVCNAPLHDPGGLHTGGLGGTGQAAAESLSGDPTHGQELKGRVVSFYNSFGDYDAVVIVELPDNEAAAAVAIAASAGGALRAIKTTPLMTAQEGLKAMRKAKKAAYQPPK